MRARKSTHKAEIAKYDRQLILGEASRLFYNFGYTGTTIDAIAESLSVTKPYIYRRFDSKSEMLAAIYQQVLAIAVAAIGPTLDGAGRPTQRLRQFSRAVAHICVEHKYVIGIFYREEAHLPTESLNDIYELKKEFDNRLRDLLREGIKAGEFSIADIDVCAQSIAGMLTWVHLWYRADKRLTPDEMAELMSDLIVKLVKAEAVNISR